MTVHFFHFKEKYCNYETIQMSLNKLTVPHIFSCINAGLVSKLIFLLLTTVLFLSYCLQINS